MKTLLDLQQRGGQRSKRYKGTWPASGSTALKNRELRDEQLSLPDRCMGLGVERLRSSVGGRGGRIDSRFGGAIPSTGLMKTRLSLLRIRSCGLFLAHALTLANRGPARASFRNSDVAAACPCDISKRGRPAGFLLTKPVRFACPFRCVTCREVA